MRITSYSVLALATAVNFAASNAWAAKSCNIVGTYTDTLGSTIVFKSTKVGTASNPTICASTYALKVKKDTSKAIDVTGTAKGCGALKGDFVPNYPTCTNATGTVTITGLGTFNDTITKQSNKVKARPASDKSALENGIH